MQTYIVFFADQDQLAVEADGFEYTASILYFTQRERKVAVFYAERVKGFVLADALLDEEGDDAEDERDF